MKKKMLMLVTLIALPLVTSLSSCKKGPTIGILQPVDHDALAASREGFVKALKDNGYPNINIDYRNAKGNSADMNLLAKDLVDTSALTLGIGTGASQALKGAQDNAGYTKPLLFTAVTDAVSAGLVTSNDNPSGYVCGTTDANPVSEQVALLKEFNPEAKKLGILYTQTEVNSQVQAAQASAAASALNITPVTSSCTGPSDINATALALVDSGVDAIYLPTDNNIAANMNAVKQAVTSRNVLVVCGEENMVTKGGHISLSINYYDLGYTTGKMAAEILKGNKKPTDYKVTPVALSDCTYAYSPANLLSAGLTMPEAMLTKYDWRNLDE